MIAHYYPPKFTDSPYVMLFNASFLVIPVPAHGLRALLPVGFDAVVDVLRNDRYASGIYFAVLNTRPRVAVAVGERFYPHVAQWDFGLHSSH